MSENGKDLLFIIATVLIAFGVIRFLAWFVPRHPVATLFAACVVLAAWVFAYAGGSD